MGSRQHACCMQKVSSVVTAALDTVMSVVLPPKTRCIVCSDATDLVKETLEQQFLLVRNRTSNNGEHRPGNGCLPR